MTGGLRLMPGTARFELEDIKHFVTAERDRQGITLREAGEQCGVPFVTLSRIENGGMPNIYTFRALLDWCGLDICDFFPRPPTDKPTLQLIAEALHSDRNLTHEAATAILAVVRPAYETFIEIR